MQPFSPHSKFFSSLKQVEKRLKLEDTSPVPRQQIPNSSITTQPSSTDDDLSAPLYIHTCNQSITSTQNSNPPQEFLSHSPDFNAPPSNISKHDQNIDEETEHSKDDIEQVLELLGLLEINKEEGKNETMNVNNGCGSFYSKIVGVKGPKSEKEMERLDGWIKYFLSNKDDDGIVKEPLRLLHLLIGKAVVASTSCNEDEDNNGGFEDIEFPSTVQEFLEHDPPT